MNRKNCVIIKRCRKKYLRKFNVHSETKGNILNILRYLQRKNIILHMWTLGSFSSVPRSKTRVPIITTSIPQCTRVPASIVCSGRKLTLRSRHRQSHWFSQRWYSRGRDYNSPSTQKCWHNNPTDKTPMEKNGIWSRGMEVEQWVLPHFVEMRTSTITVEIWHSLLKHALQITKKQTKEHLSN